MLALKLAYRNLIGAGLRTWLNVFILSISFVIIIFHKGILDGWNKQARTDLINWEYGGGQYWQSNYDPYDPFTLSDSHADIPDETEEMIKKKELLPILVAQGTIYPEGRVQSVLIKGIKADQDILQLPTEKLQNNSEVVLAVIGSNMAGNNHLDSGDYVTLRWRDVNGTFDAIDIQIAGIFKTNTPSVDNGIIWISLDNLQDMLKTPGEATLLVKSKEDDKPVNIEGWNFKGHDFLLADMDNIIKSKNAGGAIFWFILLLLAMLAIFDTQVLSIFRRQKEIGTYIALGMTKKQVVGLFTVEGAFHSILAVLVGAVYGIPLFIWQSRVGITLPVEGEDYGLAMAETLFPAYSLGLITGTILIVVITTIIVSYLPSRKISKMKPTEALRGKLQ